MKKLIGLTLILLFSINGFTQVSDSAYLDTGNISALINHYPNHFFDHSYMQHFEVPKGSGQLSMFNSALWIGGFNLTPTQQLNLHFAGERYRQMGQDFYPGPLSIDGTASVDTATMAQWEKVWKVGRDEIEQHIAWYANPSAYPGYTIPQAILNWPAHGDTSANQAFDLAPYMDYNGNGIYDPQWGDYPLIKGDQAIYFISNDKGGIHGESGGTPMGIEIHGMAYSFDCDKSFLDNAIFFEYRIINRSMLDYFDTYIALFNDYDLGYAYDDYVGCDIPNSLAYVYNGTSVDGNGQAWAYGSNPPAIGCTILKGPYHEADGIDNPYYDSTGAIISGPNITGLGFGDGIVDNETMGMERFFFTSNFGSAPYMVDPSIAIEYYNLMNGFWVDSTRLQYGGNGHPTSGAYGPECNFMFPGDSDSLHFGTQGAIPNGPQYWTEQTAGNNPYDRRGISITGPFDFISNSTVVFEFAFLWAKDTSGTFSSARALIEATDSLRYYYVNDSLPCSSWYFVGMEENVIEIPEVNLYPNPTNGNISLEFNSNSAYNYSVFDINGRLIETKSNILDQKININANDFPKGVYFIKVHSKDFNFTKKFIRI